MKFIKPLCLLVKELEGKFESGTHGYVSDVLPAYNVIKEHIAEKLEAFNSNQYLLVHDEEGERLRLKVNIINANPKLLKYRELLISPVYLAAVVLIPRIK